MLVRQAFRSLYAKPFAASSSYSTHRLSEVIVRTTMRARIRHDVAYRSWNRTLGLGSIHVRRFADSGAGIPSAGKSELKIIKFPKSSDKDFEYSPQIRNSIIGQSSGN